MAIFILVLVLNFTILCFCFAVCVNQKRQRFCFSVSDLQRNFFSYGEKFEYKKLSKSNANAELKLLFQMKQKPLNIERQLYDKKDYLLTLSKFIDFKLNSNKQTFRCKNGLLLIEQISAVVAAEVLRYETPRLFDLYKKLKYEYNLKQKEEKVFKLLLAKELIKILCDIEYELKTISKVIVKSKRINKLRHYKKQIYEVAEIYGVKKFNQNSTKILDNQKDKIEGKTKLLFDELYGINIKLKTIIAYLCIMFS